MEPTTQTPARTTPKDFFLWAGAMIALYWSLVSFTFLLFNYIDFSFPNTLNGQMDPYMGGMPYEMASLLVLVPLYIALTLFIRRDIATDASRKEIWVRRWAIILTLFVAGATVAIDVITLLTAFFSGDEITAAFLLKVLIVLVVAAAGFFYFMYDLRGYWDINKKQERSLSFGFGAVVLVAIIAGFFIVGTPANARLMRLDNQRVADLQSIQWQVVNYFQSKDALPKTLDALVDPISGYSIATDPETNLPYEYSVTDARTFALCADFARANENPSNTGSYPATSKSTPDSWAHAAGHTCFTRTIDPDLYPSLKPAAAR